MAASEHLGTLQGNELWKAWWLWGIPVAWITIALVLAAEECHLAGLHTLGNLLDVARLAVYWFWCRMAWKCSANVDHPAWSYLSKGALAAGFVAMVFT
jgi:hypothetical protein